jgi:hypothetical protein
LSIDYRLLIIECSAPNTSCVLLPRLKTERRAYQKRTLCICFTNEKP